MPVKKTTIKKNIQHDCMTLDAKFPSGAEITWKINRSGERLELALANDPKIFKEQSKVVRAFIAKLEGTNAEKFEKLESILKDCNSAAEIVAKMKTLL